MATTKTDPKEDPKRFYDQERWQQPMDAVISVRLNTKVKALLAKQAYAEGVELGSLCRRYLFVAAAEHELDLTKA